MVFQPSRLAGAFLITPELQQDNRGIFARTYCEHEFSQHGLPTRFPQCNVSFNLRRGTLRGMHFQKEPAPEPKLVRCTRGQAYDVIVDLRRDSPTYRGWQAFELTEANWAAVYIPPGFAHGFQTLVDNTELFYLMGEFYHPDLAGGARWNDAAFAIEWPLENPILSEKDRDWPDYLT